MLENHFTADPHLVETFHTPKVLILGHGQHGKNYAAEIIGKRYGLRFGDSSLEAFGAIKPELKILFPDEDDETLYQNRRQNRILWKRLIKRFNTPDRARLTRQILKKYDGYVGLRDLDEYMATRSLYDLIIWIDASARKPEDESMSIKYDSKRMIIINNNCSKDNLLKEIATKLDGIKY